MIQVQVRLPNHSVKTLDKWIKKGYFESRSDALRNILSIYEKKDRNINLFNNLNKKNSLIIKII